MTARWYVVNVYSGSENKVAESIREQAVLKKMDDRILEVLVPTEQVVEVRKGTKVNATHKFFPGYILVKMEMSDDASVIALSANPPETNAPPMSIPSAAVEQAPYSPRYGIGKSAAVKPVAVH